jgi:hypothetical protein
VGIFSRKPKPQRITEREYDATLVEGSGRFTVPIVGESYYQDELLRLSAGRCARGESVDFLALLMPEPDNKYDRNAVAIYCQDGDKIGHLSREMAEEYRDMIREYLGRDRLIACNAHTFGGHGDKKNIGVWLVLPDPFAFEGDDD